MGKGHPGTKAACCTGMLSATRQPAAPAPGEPPGAPAAAMLLCQNDHLTDKVTIMAKLKMGVTEFKARCLDVLRRTESTGVGVEILRHGRPVARLVPVAATAAPPWLCLRGRGRLLTAPEEGVLQATDFEAQR